MYCGLFQEVDLILHHFAPLLLPSHPCLCLASELTHSWHSLIHILHTITLYFTLKTLMLGHSEVKKGGEQKWKHCMHCGCYWQRRIRLQLWWMVKAWTEGKDLKLNGLCFLSLKCIFAWREESCLGLNFILHTFYIPQSLWYYGIIVAALHDVALFSDNMFMILSFQGLLLLSKTIWGWIFNRCTPDDIHEI